MVKYSQRNYFISKQWEGKELEPSPYIPNKCNAVVASLAQKCDYPTLADTGIKQMCRAIMLMYIVTCYNWVISKAYLKVMEGFSDML